MQNNTNDTKMPKRHNVPVVLWLASWYPCRLDPFNGDFIQRAARAASQKIPIHVFYLMKDENGLVTKSSLEETQTTGNLTETRLYYHPPKTGIQKFDALISAFYYTRLGRNWLKRFKRKFKSQPWIIEVGVAMRAGTLALWMKKKWNQHYLVQEHWTGYYRDLMPTGMQRGKLFWLMTRRILANADALLPDSQHLGELINQKITKIPFTEIPNTVDTNLFFYRMEQEFRVLHGKRPFRLIHVSTLGYQKNTSGILVAFDQFKQIFPKENVSLEMVGPGFEPLREMIKGNVRLLESVTFTGPLPYEEVAARMRKADALVLFSRYENLPCVMLEAFCCGLPVIATRVGGIAYHLPESHGILIDSENEEQLLNALIRMYQDYNSYDRSYIAQTSKGLYSMDKIGNLYLDTYKKIYPQLW